VSYPQQGVFAHKTLNCTENIVRTGGPVGRGVVLEVFGGFELFERVRGVEGAEGGVKRVTREIERYRLGSKRG
jgi:hypothetical protein